MCPGPKEKPSPQVLAVRQKPAFLGTCVYFPHTTERSHLPYHGQDGCLAYQGTRWPLGSLSITNACYTVQSPCWHPGSSHLFPCPELLQLTGFPPPATQFSLEPCYFGHAIALFVSLSLPPSPTPTINSALPLPLSWPGPVCWPCLAFYVFCSGPFQILLAVLSHTYSKTLPAALAWGSYVISLHKGMVEDPELWTRAWVHSLSKHTGRQLRMATRNFQLYMTWRAHGSAFCFCLFFLF